MKRSMVIVLLLSLAHLSDAQIASMNNKWEDNSSAKSNPTTKEFNEFSNTEMEEHGSVLSFSGLPELKKIYAAVITNGNGELVRQKRISPADNEVNIRSLNHRLYFVTIAYRHKGQKTFVLNR